MVWFGVALFFVAFATEIAPAAFRGQWFQFLGWVIFALAGVACAIIGVVEVRRLHRQMKKRQGLT